MSIKVAKFGGSSLADGIQIAKIREIIQADKDLRYIVVSAPGKRYDGDHKVTDLLYLCKTHIDHNLSYDQLFQVVCDRFMAMQINLGVNVDLQKYFEEIKENIKQGASEDYIASRGEYLNAILIAEYLGMDFVDTAGLIRFDKHGNMLEEETNEALGEELLKHGKAVVPGFYGTLPDGSIKTFARGGSDITGAVVARAVKADIYENWTDVSGFMMADPSIVSNPLPIETISYKELRELSYMGASVFHENAVYPARAAGIPINIRNTNEPENPGTLITAAEDTHPDKVVAGIAGSKDFKVIAIYKSMMASERGFMRKLLSILEDYDVSVEHIPSGIDNVSVIVSRKDLEGKTDDIIDEIKRKLDPETVDVFDDISLIATVGSGMSYRPGTSARLFTALASEGINIRMIDQGASEMNIIIGVDTKDFENAIRAIYAEFTK